MADSTYRVGVLLDLAAGRFRRGAKAAAKDTDRLGGSLRKAAGSGSLMGRRTAEGTRGARREVQRTTQEAKRLGGTLRDTGRRGEQSLGRLTRRSKTFRTEMGRAALTAGRLRGRLLGIAGIAGGGFAIAAGLKRVISMETRIERLGIQAERTTGDMERLLREVNATANLPDILLDPSQLLAGVEAIVEKTGDLDFARDNLVLLAQAIQGSGGTGDALGRLSAELRKLGITDPAGVAQALNLITAQGKSGAFTIGNMASQGERLFSAFAKFKYQGQGAVRQLGAISQMARQSTGSSEQAATAVEALLRTLSDAQKIDAIWTEFGVNVQDASGGFRPLDQIVKELIDAAGGDITRLSGIIDAEALRAISGLTTAQGRADYERFLTIEAPADMLGRDAARIAETTGAKIQETKTDVEDWMQDKLTGPLGEVVGALTSFKDELLVGVGLLAGSWYAFKALRGAGRLLARLAGRGGGPTTRPKLTPARPGGTGPTTRPRSGEGRLGGTGPGARPSLGGGRLSGSGPGTRPRVGEGRLSGTGPGARPSLGGGRLSGSGPGTRPRVGEGRLSGTGPGARPSLGGGRLSGSGPGTRPRVGEGRLSGTGPGARPSLGGGRLSGSGPGTRPRVGEGRLSGTGPGARPSLGGGRLSGSGPGTRPRVGEGRLSGTGPGARPSLGGGRLSGSGPGTRPRVGEGRLSGTGPGARPSLGGGRLSGSGPGTRPRVGEGRLSGTGPGARPSLGGGRLSGSGPGTRPRVGEGRLSGTGPGARPSLGGGRLSGSGPGTRPRVGEGRLSGTGPGARPSLGGGRLSGSGPGTRPRVGEGRLSGTGPGARPSLGGGRLSGSGPGTRPRVGEGRLSGTGPGARPSLGGSLWRLLSRALGPAGAGALMGLTAHDIATAAIPDDQVAPEVGGLAGGLAGSSIAGRTASSLMRSLPGPIRFGGSVLAGLGGFMGGDTAGRAATKAVFDPGWTSAESESAAQWILDLIPKHDPNAPPEIGNWRGVGLRQAPPSVYRRFQRDKPRAVPEWEPPELPEIERDAPRRNRGRLDIGRNEVTVNVGPITVESRSADPREVAEEVADEIERRARDRGLGLRDVLLDTATPEAAY